MFGRNLMGALLVIVFASMAFSCFTADSTDVESAAVTQLPLGNPAFQISAEKLDVRNLFVKN
jgi:hypothetical protein